MKKSKVILAIVLAVVLLITILSVPTFSWFTRPQTLSGEKMILNSKNEYTAFNGNSVTMSTLSSATGVENSYNTSVTDSAGLSESEGKGINTNRRKYFRTTISNSSTVAQNVSLYANKLSIPAANNGTLALGVNSPTRSYRDYSSLANQTFTADRDVMRIYFEKDNNVTGWNGTEFYICWNESTDLTHETLGSKGENGTYYKLTHVGGSNNPNQYYADIPRTATHAFFAVANWGTNNNGEPNWGQRSQELCNLASDGQTQTSSKLFKITSAYKDNNSNSNHLVHTPPYDVNGNCINHYYTSISLAVGTTYEAALTNTAKIPTTNGNSANFIGTLKYYSTNNNNNGVFTVDENTGLITAVGAGEAILYTKSTGGSYPDEQEVQTTIKVTAAADYEFNDVPIVRNLEVPAGESVDVYWYVINNSESKALKYTIDSLYIGM